MKCPFCSAARLINNWALNSGLNAGTAKANICKMSEPPVFKVRKSDTGFGWVVEIIWGGETEAIDGFASEKAAIDWITKVYEILAKEK
jgi:hypothetical protein